MTLHQRRNCLGVTPQAASSCLEGVLVAGKKTLNICVSLARIFGRIYSSYDSGANPSQLFALEIGVNDILK